MSHNCFRIKDVCNALIRLTEKGATYLWSRFKRYSSLSFGSPMTAYSGSICSPPFSVTFSRTTAPFHRAILEDFTRSRQPFHARVFEFQALSDDKRINDVHVFRREAGDFRLSLGASDALSPPGFRSLDFVLVNETLFKRRNAEASNDGCSLGF